MNQADFLTALEQGLRLRGIGFRRADLLEFVADVWPLAQVATWLGATATSKCAPCSRVSARLFSRYRPRFLRSRPPAHPNPASEEVPVSHQRAFVQTRIIVCRRIVRDTHKPPTSLCIALPGQAAG